MAALQALGATNGTLVMQHCLVTHFITGGQLDDSTLVIEESGFHNFPEQSSVRRLWVCKPLAGGGLNAL